MWDHRCWQALGPSPGRRMTQEDPSILQSSDLVSRLCLLKGYIRMFYLVNTTHAKYQRSVLVKLPTREKTSSQEGLAQLSISFWKPLAALMIPFG